MLHTIRQLTGQDAVIVTNFPETYLLSRYLQRHSTAPIRMIMSSAALANTLRDAFYEKLPGTLLEGLARLLATNVKLYVAPMTRDAFRAAAVDASGAITIRDSGKSIVTLDDLLPSAPNLHLFQYLRASGRIVGVQ